MRVRNALLSAFGLLAVAAIAACGGANPSTNYPTAPISSATASSNGTTVTIPQASGLAVGSASIAGSGTFKVSQSVSGPSSASALISTRMAKVRAESSPSGNIVIAYLTVTASTNVTMTSATFNVASTSALPSGTFYLAFWNGSQWVTVGNAAKVSSSGVITVSSGTLNPPVTLSAGSSYYFAVYTGAILTTPSPEPSPPVASPNPVSMDLLTTTTVYVATNPGLTVTATSSNTSIATVTASATAAPDGEAPFTVAGVGAGTAKLTFTDPINQTTTDQVTVLNQLPTPVPSPASFVIYTNDSTTIQVNTAANLTITATSSNTAVATVTSSAQANSEGIATFTVNGISSGAATLTFSDQYSDTDTATVDVSPIQNGTFTSSTGSGTLGAWTPCSYARTSLSGPVDPSPAPEASGDQAPPATTPPYGSPGNAVAVVTPPANFNPSITATMPPVLGNNVVLTGGTPAPTADGVASSLNEGAVGVCQTITLDSTNEYLSFWVYEAGLYGPFYDADQEADILNSSGTALYSSGTSSILFAELNCFGDPGVLTESSYTSSKCIPSTLGGTASTFYYQGGYWTQRGPYNITDYGVSVGSSFTIFLGVWDWETKAGPTSYGNVMFAGDVEMTDSPTFPTNAPYTKTRKLTIALPTRRIPSGLVTRKRP